MLKLSHLNTLKKIKEYFLKVNMPEILTFVSLTLLITRPGDHMFDDKTQEQRPKFCSLMPKVTTVKTKN